MLVRNTLTEAMAVRPRPGAIGLILSLEGARYYVFHSYQTRDQLASSNLRAKLDLHNALSEKLSGLTETNMQLQQRYENLIGFARQMATQAGIPPEGRHAEEVMIENWDACTADFQDRRDHFPRKADVFLTYCPCQPQNTAPSPIRTIHDFVYPVSCAEKLKLFCSIDNRIGMKWSVYYEHPFGNVPGLDWSGGNLRIGKLPQYITLPG